LDGKSYDVQRRVRDALIYPLVRSCYAATAHPPRCILDIPEVATDVWDASELVFSVADYHLLLKHHPHRVFAPPLQHLHRFFEGVFAELLIFGSGGVDGGVSAAHGACGLAYADGLLDIIQKDIAKGVIIGDVVIFVLPQLGEVIVIEVAFLHHPTALPHLIRVLPLRVWVDGP
jgi:hypothetical protein